MQVELKLVPGQIEPKIVVLAGEETPEIRQLVEDLARRPGTLIQVWKEECSYMLPQSEFLRFFTEGKRVAAQTSESTYEVRLRLYELEERLDPLRFVRISNSEIINLNRVTAVDLSMAGTICMTLDGHTAAYVSRRYVKRIKETLKQGRRAGL